MRTRTLLAALTIVFAALVAYHNCINGSLVFDDWPTIKENDSIRDWSKLRDILLPRTQHTTAGRPLANLSLAINYSISGEAVWSYHVFNLVIHTLAGLAMFGLVRRTLELPRLRERFGSVASTIGFLVALLWTLHPLATESVTYIVQRTESLVGLFYVLTLYGFARSVLEPGRRRWAAFALGACYCGMMSKEVMVTAPVMALLYHRAFVSGSFRETWKQRWRWLLAMAAGWILLGIALASTGGNRGGSVGLGVGVRFFDYWLTQPRALAYYLKLAIWPDPLVFEYGTEWITRAGQVVPYALIVAPLIMASLVALWRWPRIGFLGAWFFGILAPTSLTPGVNQMIVEHRTYLPLVAVISLVVMGAYMLGGRRTLLFWVPVAFLFACLTIERNRDYRNVTTLWTDTVAKRPENALARRILADFLWQDENNAVRFERIPQALAHYRESLRLSPQAATTHENYGAVLLLLGDLNGSATESLEAIRLSPDNYLAHYNLGLACVGLGRMPDATREFASAVKLNPEYVNARKNFANALAQTGRVEAALSEYEAALKLKPRDPEALYNQGNALFNSGRFAQAAERYEAVLEATPDDPDAHQNLGRTLVRLGRNRDALAHLDRAAELARAPQRPKPAVVPRIQRMR